MFPKLVTYTLRGVCMLLIIICHTVTHEHRISPPFFLKYLCVEKWGMWASALFLLLSGYGLYISLNSKEINFTYIIRILRKLIVPFVFIWICYLLFFFFFDKDLLQIVLFADFFTFAVPYSETWFFREICALYIISLIIFVLFRNNKLRVFFIWIICFSFYFYCAHITHFRPLHLGRHWWNAVLCFPIGMSMAWKINLIEKINPYIILFLFFLLLFLFTIIHPSDILGNISFSITVLYLFSIANVHFRVLSFIGTYSLFYYLLETPVKRYFSSTTFNFYLYIILTIVGITLLTNFYLFISKYIKKYDP